MGSIEGFRAKLQETRRIMGERLQTKKGPDAIADALDEMKRVEKTLKWLPKPETPGVGTTGEETIRMARGKKP